MTSQFVVRSRDYEELIFHLYMLPYTPSFCELSLHNYPCVTSSSSRSQIVQFEALDHTTVEVLFGQHRQKHYCMSNKIAVAFGRFLNKNINWFRRCVCEVSHTVWLRGNETLLVSAFFFICDAPLILPSFVEIKFNDILTVVPLTLRH